MRYLALACDYDGTLAHDGEVPDSTIEALERLKASDRRLLMVTGRELEDLKTVFSPLELFDLIVAENGALVYEPTSKDIRLLTEPPPEKFARTLQERGVQPLSVGHVIVATREPNEQIALEVIRDQGLELEIIFNKGAVMILPSGVNKARGMVAALHDLGLSARNVVGVGDAENDLAFLRMCECGVAVANALGSVKEACDYVTDGARGAGVEELIGRILEDDLRSLEPRLTRHCILVGERAAEADAATAVTATQTAEDAAVSGDLLLHPARVRLLVAGPEASGKSTFTTGLMERLRERGYQFCVVDPEGDYQAFRGGVLLGDAERAPLVDEVLSVLTRSDESVVVNLLGLNLEERPAFFRSLIPRLQDLRARTGRPHWLIIDEAHHLLPAERKHASLTIPREFGATLFVTVHPEMVSAEVLSSIDLLVAIGSDTKATVEAFARAAGRKGPSGVPTLEPGQGLAWWPDRERPPVVFRVMAPKERMKRHRRKYVEGELVPDDQFYFRGPNGKLNLRAQNLRLFAQLADGVDDDTWLHHLRQRDYSEWFRRVIKDEELAAETARVEQADDLDAKESRNRILALIDERYTL